MVALGAAPACVSPVLTAPVSAVPALLVTVLASPCPFRPVKTAPSSAGGGFDRTERAGTRSNVRKQGRNSADECDEDRALISRALGLVYVVRLHGEPHRSSHRSKLNIAMCH